MRIVWSGQSAFRVEFADKVVLFDPFFTSYPGVAGDPARAGEGATHICLTHGHLDHLGDAAEIAARTGARVIANAEVCSWLSATKGVEATEPVNTGGSLDLGGFTVTFVRSAHSVTDMEGAGFMPMGPPNGIVLAAPGEPTLYHMGQTDLFGSMALIEELHRPDILLVPIGGRFTMGAERAACAVRRFFRPKAVIPCHYGSFPDFAPDADAFVAAMEGSEVQVVVPPLGMGVRFTA
ncbi:MAG: metal-dependent hydrolase [Methylobacteriaceae bacterium]|nr:metal-dependent hydrolase [Methylobacteriaceae bacterium]